ncbi:MAG TPA: FAD-dependent oxidoreductase [Solirubrobacterales bacterium]
MFVGGGVIGLACAWRAAQQGARVLVLERAEPPAGATNVAAGMLAPVGELTFGERELLELTLASGAAWADFAAEVEAAGGESTAYERCGALHVALDRDEAGELRRHHDLQRELGLEAEWLTPRQCRELEPGLVPTFVGGVLAGAEASVDPRRLALALAAALRAAGGELRTGTEVVEGLWDGDRLIGVRTAPTAADVPPRAAPAASVDRAVSSAAQPVDLGSPVGDQGLRVDVYADAVVLCNGAWSGQMAWLPDKARPPVRPVKGEVVELRPRDEAPAPAGRIIASERVYLVPRPDGRLIVGATQEERGFDTVVTAGGVHELLREAYRVLPDVAEMEFAGAIAGLRPGTPDNLPIVGRAALDGLVYATGHFRNGILLAPLTADAVAATLAGAEPPAAMAPADPNRSSLVAHRATKDNRLTGLGAGR